MIKRFFFPAVDNDVRELMDETSTRNIENISAIVAIFETLTLLYFVRPGRALEVKNGPVLPASSFA